VRVNNLNFSGKSIYSDLDDLVEHVNKVIEFTEEGVEQNNNQTGSEGIFMYEINYPYISDEKLDSILKQQNYNFNKYSLLKRIKAEINEKTKTNLQKELETLDLKIEFEKICMNSPKKTSITKIDDVFLTFVNQKLASHFYNLYNKNLSTRCIMIFCCQGRKLKPF